MSDLFASSRRGGPETSREAAEAVQPSVQEVAAQVAEFARQRGPEGFIDEDLGLAFQGFPESTFRKRRTELAQRNYILDSGARRENGNGRRCIVWVHREHFEGQAPAILAEARPNQPTSEERQEGFAMARELEQWGESMRKEGRAMFASGLANAARIMRALSR
jgi:hypothetical protein